HTAELEDHLVDVGEHSPFPGVEQVSRRPMRDSLHLLVRDARRSRTLAVLREHELTANSKARAKNAEFDEVRRDNAVLTLVQGSAGLEVGKHFGDERNNGPPVAGRPCGSPGFGNRVTVPKHPVIRCDDLGRCPFARHLSQSWHSTSPAHVGRGKYTTGPQGQTYRYRWYAMTISGGLRQQHQGPGSRPARRSRRGRPSSPASRRIPRSNED